MVVRILSSVANKASLLNFALCIEILFELAKQKASTWQFCVAN